MYLEEKSMDMGRAGVGVVWRDVQVSSPLGAHNCRGFSSVVKNSGIFSSGPRGGILQWGVKVDDLEGYNQRCYLFRG